MTVPTLREVLNRDGTIYCGWCVMPHPLSAEAMARQDWDCILIDGQHGLIDFPDVLAMLVAIQGAGKPALVRPPLSDKGFIGKALDAGADAVVCPMINTPEDARWLADATNYPPVGERSWGPRRAIDRFGLDSGGFHARGDDLTEAWAMIETREALDNLDAILETEGIDGVFVGPNDLCNSLTCGDTVDPGHPEVLAALSRVLKKARDHGKFAGVYANSIELARAFEDLGFRFIATGSDANFLRSASAAALSRLKHRG